MLLEILDLASELNEDNTDENKRKTVKLVKLLRKYINLCDDMAVEQSNKKNHSQAEDILQGCGDFIATQLPHLGQKQAVKQGLMFTVYSNLAKNANSKGDVQ